MERSATKTGDQDTKVVRREHRYCAHCPISAYCLSVGRSNVITNSTICSTCGSMVLWLSRGERMVGRGFYLRIFAPCVGFREIVASTTKSLCGECVTCWEEKNNGSIRTAERYRALGSRRDKRFPKGRYRDDLNNPSYQKGLCLLQGCGDLPYSGG